MTEDVVGRNSIDLDDLEAIAGIDAALAFVERHGGRSIYIAKLSQFRNDNRLIEGRDAAIQLAMQYGGQSYYVAQSRHRRAHIYARRGLDLGEIARRLGTTPRSVRRYLATT